MKLKLKVTGAGTLPKPAAPADSAPASAAPTSFQPAGPGFQQEIPGAYVSFQQRDAGEVKQEAAAHAPTHASVPKLIIKKRKPEDVPTADVHQNKRLHTDNGQPPAVAPLPSTSSAAGAGGGGGIKLRVKLGGVKQQPATGHTDAGQNAGGFLDQISSGALGPPASQLQHRPGGFLQEVVAAGGLESKQAAKAQEKARKAQEKAQTQAQAKADQEARKAKREAELAEQDMLAQVMGDALGFKPKIKLKIKTAPAAAAPAPLGFGSARPAPAPGHAPLPSISSAPSVSKPAPKLRIKLTGGTRPAGLPAQPLQAGAARFKPARADAGTANGTAQPYQDGGISQLLEGLQDFAAGLPPATAARAPASASKARPRPGRVGPGSGGAVSRSAEKPPRPVPKRPRHLFDEDGDDLMDEDFDPRLLKPQRMPGEGRPSRGQPSSGSAVGGARLYLLMEKVLEGVSKKDESQNNIFKAPVTDEIAPGYSDKIKHPMCFDTMRDKLRAGQYSSWALFEGDMRLVFDNAQIYNAAGSFVHHHASYLREVSQKYLAEAKRGNTNFRGVAAGITRKYMAEWFRLHPQQKPTAALQVAAQAGVIGEVRTESGALRDKKLRAGPSGAATAKERHTRQELQAQAAAQAAAQAYGRGLRQHANMSYAEDAPAQPRQARKGRRGQQVVAGVLRPVRAIDPDAKRMATVYVRRSEQEELRDTYAPAVPAAQVPAAMWKGLSGGANAEGIDYATYGPWALRACWPGAIHTTIASAWQAWQLHNAAAAASSATQLGAGASSTMGYMGAGLPLDGYTKSMSRFLGRAHGAVRKAVLASRLVGCMTVEGGQDPAAFNPTSGAPAAGVKPPGLPGGVASAGLLQGVNPGAPVASTPVPTLASQLPLTGSQGAAALPSGLAATLSTAGSSAFTGSSLQLPANLLAGLASSGLSGLQAGATTQPASTAALNPQANALQPANVQKLLQPQPQQQAGFQQQPQQQAGGALAGNLLLGGQQASGGQLPSQLLQQQQQLLLLRQIPGQAPSQPASASVQGLHGAPAALQGLQGPSTSLQPALGLQTNAMLQGLRQPGLSQAQQGSSSAPLQAQLQQGSLDVSGGPQQHMNAALQQGILQASAPAASQAPNQPLQPAQDLEQGSHQSQPLTGLDLLSSAALELGRSTPQLSAGLAAVAQQPVHHAQHAVGQQQGEQGPAHAVQQPPPGLPAGSAPVQVGLATGATNAPTEPQQQPLIEQPSEKLIERVSLTSDSPSTLPDLPPATP